MQNQQVITEINEVQHRTVSYNQRNLAPKRNQKHFSVSSAIIRGFDISISALLLVFLFPGIALIAAISRITDKGDVLFSQYRVGFHQSYFKCYKFRSMRPNSDYLFSDYLARNPDEYEAFKTYRKVNRDPRITPFGHLLRKSSLDELPQLLNVLRGEMSLVGPRPILPGEADQYGRSLRLYGSVRPGITGLWQIMGRNNISYNRRIALDRVFVRKRSVGLYLYILLATVPVVLFRHGAR